ncbi:MAG: hypothetical protein H7Y00_11380 [Fimbriimonadaceae bacterium]|nr:hypothetical protein [Chitinophagales bacterium]
MQTPGVTIQQIEFKEGEHILKLNKESVYSIYVISGKIETDGGKLSDDDFILIRNEDVFNFSSASHGKVFMISSPLEVSYKTYAENM